MIKLAMLKTRKKQNHLGWMWCLQIISLLAEAVQGSLLEPWVSASTSFKDQAHCWFRRGEGTGGTAGTRGQDRLREAGTAGTETLRTRAGLPSLHLTLFQGLVVFLKWGFFRRRGWMSVVVDVTEREGVNECLQWWKEVQNGPNLCLQSRKETEENGLGSRRAMLIKHGPEASVLCRDSALLSC